MNITQSKGFTLFEMILTVAVMAILVSITTPSIYEFIRQRDKQNEEIAQMQVRRALEAYVADNGVAPSDSATGNSAWYNVLAGYTNLSADEIANDIWGNPRTYIAYTDTSRNIYGTTVSVVYATLHSMGEDGRATNQDQVGNNTVTVPGIALATSNGRTVFSGSTSPQWWKAQADKVDAFAKVRGADDDIMLRYTNYEDVLARYNTTQDRLNKLGEALETYARSQYANHVAACSSVTAETATCNGDGTPKLAIYYPKSLAVQNTADSARYIKNGALTNTVLLNNAVADATRRTQMEDVMTELGLPLDYCCSALERGTDDKPKPFYYFSNPRPRGASACGVRPATEDAKLPARITTSNSNDASSNRTCG